MQPMSRKPAEDLGLAVLAWIAEDSERAGAFLGASGAAPGDLRARVRDPDFLGFVLDFLLMDDAAVLAFAAEQGRPPEDVMRARAGLPGGDLPAWT
ncbi:MAG: DUF3572 domain-containing protein [Pseudomonadota bacterium]